MKCKIFFLYGREESENDVNNWLKNSTISIEKVVASEKYIIIFYSDRKGKLENLNGLD